MACFDMAFHCIMLRLARLLPLSNRFDANEVQRRSLSPIAPCVSEGELARLRNHAASKALCALRNSAAAEDARMDVVGDGQSPE